MSTLSQLAGDVPVSQPRKPNGHDVSNLSVIPYNGNYDENAANMLHYLWEKLKADGLVDLYFPGASKTGFCSFVKLFSSAPSVQVLLVVKKDTTGDVTDVIGFATWEPITIGQCVMGHAGFIFLKEFWDRDTTAAAAREIMGHWFSATPLDIAVGIVASTNHLANRFLHRIGWTKVGVLPKLHQFAGTQCDAVIWHMTRENFVQEGK